MSQDEPPPTPTEHQQKLQAIELREKEAAARKAEIETQKAALDLRKFGVETELAQWKALVPDFSALKVEPIKLPEDKTLFANFLAGCALQDAAQKVARRVARKTPSTRILVTSDSDLASRTAAAQDVRSALSALATHVKSILDALAADASGGLETDGVGFAPAGLAVSAAVASALPSLLSLFATRSTLTISSIEKNDLAAALAVMEVLVGGADGKRVYVHDEFRVPAEGEILAQMRALEESRRKLVVRQAELADGLAAAPAGSALNRQTTQLAQADAAIAAIDAFVTSIHSLPAGARRSRLAEAVLYEGCVPATGKEPEFGAVLLIKSNGGQSQQLLEERTLQDDTVHIIAEVSISYLLIETQTSGVMAAGTVSGIKQMGGKLGEMLTELLPS